MKTELNREISKIEKSGELRTDCETGIFIYESMGKRGNH